MLEVNEVMTRHDEESVDLDIKGNIEGTDATEEKAVNEETVAESAEGSDAAKEQYEDYSNASSCDPIWNKPMTLSVSMPPKNHSVQSLTNLINSIYTWGSFISNITGGKFRADKYFVNTVNHREFEDIDELLTYVKEQTERGVGLTGLRFEDEKVTFDGFKEVLYAQNCGTYSRFAFSINRHALNTKCIKAKELTNGKRIFAAWLTRIGMKGEDFKSDREALIALMNEKFDEAVSIDRASSTTSTDTTDGTARA